MTTPIPDDTEASWFVMRDLKRANASQPAYRMLADRGITVFTPMTWRLTSVRGKRKRCRRPFIHDLLFVYDTRAHLDPIVGVTPTLQYRWLRHTFRQPMTVSRAEMERFIHAVEQSSQPKYFMPEELTPLMCGRRIRIVGGQLDGYVGTLLTLRGSRTRRLLVELPGIMAVGVEVNPDYIQFVDD